MIKKFLKNYFLKIFFICLIISFILYIFLGISIFEGFILGNLVFISSMMIITSATDIIFSKQLNLKKKFSVVLSFIFSFILKTFISISLISLVFVLKANIIAFLIGVLCSFVLFIFIFIKEYKIKGGDSV